jgi:hypothetical protein
VITAVDTNVLLDLLIPASTYGSQAENLLFDAAERGSVIICDLVYAELVPQFKNLKSLKQFMNDVNLKRVSFTAESLDLAAKTWSSYLKRRRQGKIQCPACGTIEDISCANCGEQIGVRQHILADFLIGAHAHRQADRLLSRDRGYYNTYFPNLKLIDPAAG